MTRLKTILRELGDGYRIREIDLEDCIYRDFGNGFNVEISNIGSRKKDAKVNIFLWFADRQPECIIADSIHDVDRNAEAIREAVERLHALSDQLIAEGYDTREKLFKRKYPQLREEV